MVIHSEMDNLLWNPYMGCGFYPVSANEYDESYFDKCDSYADTEIGVGVNNFRIDLVNKYVSGKILDIGIGSGTFIERRGNCLGYDVNPTGIKFLKEKELYFDPYENDLKDFEGITFFDVLEHIEDPTKILDRIGNQIVFVSIPIFKDKEQIRNSKHFRPTEHYHYFTEQGFLIYMWFNGFELVEKCDGEIKAGREDIMTFVFRRFKGEKKIIINQFNKIGDILVSIPASKELIRMGYKVCYPMYHHMLGLKYHFPSIEFIDKNDLIIDYDCRELCVNGLNLIVPLRYSNNIINNGIRIFGLRSKTELYNKYFGLGLDKDFWRTLNWDRNLDKEKELMNKLGVEDGEKYNLINEFYAGGYKRIITVQNRYKNIYMDKVEGFDILDWSHVIENAETIHTVVTSLLIITEVLSTRAKELHLYKRPHEPDMENVKHLIKKIWTEHK